MQIYEEHKRVQAEIERLDREQMLVVGLLGSIAVVLVSAIFWFL